MSAVQLDTFGLTPTQKKRARRQSGRKKGAARAARANKLHPHPVPLPVDFYGGPRGDGERARRASGTTSLRVSKKTLELLRLVEKQAMEKANNRERAIDERSGWGYSRTYYNLGLDELLYWDALQRLAQLPENFEKVR